MAISIPSSVAPAAVPDRSALGRDSASGSPAVSGGGAATSNPDPGQDQVTLSSDAVAAAQSATGAPAPAGAQAAPVVAAPGTQPTSATAAQVAQGTRDAGRAPVAKPSTLKSFAYGTLGLEHPDQQEHDADSSYSAGRWLAAAVTAGAMISLLV
jgi:hypothetical protein